MLKKITDQTPKNWKARQEEANEISIAYWDDDHANACKAKDEITSGKKVIDNQLSYSKAYFLQAYIEVELKHPEQAFTYINKGLALEPDSPHLHGEKSAILKHMGETEASLRESDFVLENITACVLDKTRAGTLRRKGIALIDLNRLDEAEYSLNKSLEYENHPIAHNELKYIEKIRSGEITPSSATIIKTTTQKK